MKKQTKDTILPESAKCSTDEIVHIVAKGDTLRSIAATYYGDPRKADHIARVNGLATQILKVGRKLRITK